MAVARVGREAAQGATTLAPRGPKRKVFIYKKAALRKPEQADPVGAEHLVQSGLRDVER